MHASPYLVTLAFEFLIGEFFPTCICHYFLLDFCKMMRVEDCIDFYLYYVFVFLFVALHFPCSSIFFFFFKPFTVLPKFNHNLNRCGAEQSGDLGPSSEEIDGILGFGQGDSSMISQLASSGTIRKIFAHCLDSGDGSGIFAIGNVVQPKVNSTPLVPNQYVM